MEGKQTSNRYALAQTILLIFFAAIIFLTPKDYLFVSGTATVAGNALCGAGLLVIILAFTSLRGAIQIAPEPKQGAHLVETGIYKYFRHPIYTGIIFCLIGLFLRQPTVWVAFATAMVILFLFFKARLEEKLLLDVYPGYADYRLKTWGLFPGLRN